MYKIVFVVVGNVRCVSNFRWALIFLLAWVVVGELFDDDGDRQGCSMRRHVLHHVGLLSE